MIKEKNLQSHLWLEKWKGTLSPDTTKKKGPEAEQKSTADKTAVDTEMPNYSKFMKDVLTKRRMTGEFETVALTQDCSQMVQGKIPRKLKDPGTFTIPCTIGDIHVRRAICDLGANINLMPLSVFKKLGIGAARSTTVTLQIADRSICYPQGKIEDVLVRVDKFIFPADFIIMDFTADEDTPILLGSPFLATGRTLIDVEKGELTMRVNNQEVTFNVLKAMEYPHEQVEDVSLLQCWDCLVQKQFVKNNDHLKNELTLLENKELVQEGIVSGTPSKELKPH
ncbi:hypothetical protein A2U01_0016081, partial [Trifolium medium]|nr:hypothetical protein [Trifolium medium]